MWLEEFDGADNVTKMALMLGTVMERIDNVIMIRGTEAVAEEERASVLSPNPEVGNGSTSVTSSISDTSNTLATYQTLATHQTLATYQTLATCSLVPRLFPPPVFHTASDQIENESAKCPISRALSRIYESKERKGLHPMLICSIVDGS